MHQYLIFQAYGNIDIIQECKYALIRLKSIYKNSPVIPGVIIYTDIPSAFDVFKPVLPIIIEKIDDSKIALWRGKIEFVHRVKIEIIKDAFQKYGGKGVYMDTDTYCKRILTPLIESVSPSQVFFHCNEGTIAKPGNLHIKKWKKFLSQKKIPFLTEPDPIQITMWNAGVIGLDESHLPLLDIVLEITDKLYPLFPRHTVEQFAFCYTFQKAAVKITAAAPYIFHYWNLKEFRLLLADFFANNSSADVNTLINRSEQILPEQIVEAKLKFQKASVLTRVFKKISGNEWKIGNYKID
ncbi:hypothetical protein [Segetibacter koreensis]|uniref:hypothetical protein n=1 Tax=Segetibacter koreensis TaxID=398037 RepID=UPI0003759D84|nr:hypothetical protein [Segetibacter koreensis]